MYYGIVEIGVVGSDPQNGNWLRASSTSEDQKSSNPKTNSLRKIGSPSVSSQKIWEDLPLRKQVLRFKERG